MPIPSIEMESQPTELAATITTAPIVVRLGDVNNYMDEYTDRYDSDWTSVPTPHSLPGAVC
jgi:hypothetical protein